LTCSYSWLSSCSCSCSRSCSWSSSCSCSCSCSCSRSWSSSCSCSRSCSRSEARPAHAHAHAHCVFEGVRGACHAALTILVARQPMLHTSCWPNLTTKGRVPSSKPAPAWLPSVAPGQATAAHALPTLRTHAAHPPPTRCPPSAHALSASSRPGNHLRACWPARVAPHLAVPGLG